MLIAINVNENNLDLCIYLSFVKLVTKLNCYKIVFNFIYFTQNIYYVIRGTLKKYIIYTKGYRKAGLIPIKKYIQKCLGEPTKSKILLSSVHIFCCRI